MKIKNAKKTPVKARLYDVLMDDFVLPPLPAENNVIDPRAIAAHTSKLRSLLGGAKVIEATNVARFFDDAYLHGGGSFDGFFRDLKCLVPPHRRFFIEWENPQVPNATRMGSLMFACPVELAAETASAILGASTMLDLIVTYQKNQKNLRCRWIYIALDFLQFVPAPAEYNHVSNLRGPFNIGLMAVSDEGDVLDFVLSVGTGALPQDQAAVVAAASCVAWTTVAMLNCQNIDTTEVAGAPEAFQKARVRRGKKPLVSYSTVSVNMTKTPRSIQSTPLSGDGATRLHDRRGHMKDYRKGKGLFGRYKGLWYWGPTLAGSADEGVVESDYKMENKP